VKGGSKEGRKETESHRGGKGKRRERYIGLYDAVDDECEYC